MELGKRGYTMQATIYLKTNEIAKAYDLSKEFVVKFPDEAVAHFLLGEAALESKKYDEAISEANIAFRKCTSDQDALSCAVLTGCAYCEAKRYTEGIAFLRPLEHKKTNENLEILLFIIAMSMHDGKEAAQHLDHLYKLNKNAADEMISRYLRD